MKAPWILGVVMAALVVAPALSEATPHQTMPRQTGAECTVHLTNDAMPSPWTQEHGYIDQATNKLVFGGKNALLGWLELYNEPRDAVRAHQSFLSGMGHGIVNMLADTVGGVVQVVTFPITALDVALPQGGTDLL